MKIRMLKNENGSVDGIRVTLYEKDQEYDLTGSAGERELATAFVNARMAEEVKAEPAQAQTIIPVVTMTAEQSDAREVQEAHPTAEVEEKAGQPVEENKAMPPAPENKVVAPAENKRQAKRKG